MSVYQISVNYKTGDTFRSSEETRVIPDIEWTDIDIAKESLKYIEEHYRLYMLHNKDWNADKQQLKKSLQEASQKPWFNGVAIKKNKSIKYERWEYSLKLKVDDGSFKEIYTFWCGYFESLWDAEIIVREDTEMKISFK